MVGSLAKYIARAPRYILMPDDNTLIRLAGPQQLPWEEGTEIQNVSLTGLAFTSPADLCPMIGEIVKIQFEVPQASQMACLGLVIRLEKKSKTITLVGIKFLKLDLAQRLYMTQSLSKKLREQQAQQRSDEFRMEWKSKAPKAVLAWFFLGLWMIALWTWMSGFLNVATVPFLK